MGWKHACIILILVLLLFLVACTLEQCPKNCMDGNSCTEGYCSEETDYECIHKPVSGETSGCSSGFGCFSYACVEGECKQTKINNCCGNYQCEEGETYGTCRQDCKITEKECRQFRKENNTFSYMYYNSDCKNTQIIVCKDLDYRHCDEYWEGTTDKLGCQEKGKFTRTSASNTYICFLNLATGHNDYELCNYIDTQYHGDEYWYCMARLRYGQSACAYIKQDYWLRECLQDAPG